MAKLYGGEGMHICAFSSRIFLLPPAEGRILLLLIDTVVPFDKK